MRKEVPLQPENSRVYFGKGVKSACILGPDRESSVQQRFVCASLVKKLRELEEKGAIVHDNEILVIPQPQEVNEMFCPETQEYSYVIRFQEVEREGDSVPYIEISDAGFQNPSLANLFGYPYVVIRQREEEETAEEHMGPDHRSSNAFCVYTGQADQIDEEAARRAVAAVLRFLTRMGVLRYTSHSGYIASVIREEDLSTVRSDHSGLYRRLVQPGTEVHRGEVLALLTDPFDGEVLSEILSPSDGIVFYARRASEVLEGSIVFQIIRRLHE